jgi:alpha-1,3-rhamnosyl/mannosyltransferase
MSARIHVGVDATTWWNDRGFGRFTRELLKALLVPDSAFRYTLVVDREPSGELPDGARVLCTATRRSLTEAAVQDGARSPLDLLAMSRLVLGERFDLFFYPAVYSYFPLLSRVPCVVAFHDTIAERYPELVFPTRKNQIFWNAKVALAKLQATRVMTVSRASAEDLERILHIPAARIDLVTEGPDPVFRKLDDTEAALAVRARFGIDAQAPLLVYVGGLSPHKNLLGLLRAMPAVLQRHPEVRLAIVGDTSGKGFHDNVAELQGFVGRDEALRTRVHFTGYVSDEDLVQLYNTATALVFPSLWEGFGLPAVEAMACGLPVLASRRGSLPEVVSDAGLLFEPDDPSDIARKILSLLDDGELRARLGPLALLRARSFSWERGARLAEASFMRALGKS